MRLGTLYTILLLYFVIIKDGGVSWRERVGTGSFIPLASLASSSSNSIVIQQQPGEKRKKKKRDGLEMSDK